MSGETIDWRAALAKAIDFAKANGDAQAWARISDTMLRAGVHAQLGPGGQWMILDQVPTT